MGVIYTYGFNNVYNLVKLSFLPTGYARLLTTFLLAYGIWLLL